MKKIRRDDEVVVLTGKDRGKRGKVLAVRADNRLVVQGVNLVKKHQKPQPALGRAGGIITREAPVQASNVAIWNPESEKADRVGFSLSDEGKKQRVFKSNGKPVDV
ncbi:MAG: 50S ribosomal protein L24 [Kistimonas sp.]|nr:50S ribosomal protein L24 [Kistimonas sp.]